MSIDPNLYKGDSLIIPPLSFPARKFRVLIGCEKSGVVRRAFRALGHDAWSCDILPADDGDEHHFCCNVEYVIAYKGPWDLMIAHPPCTHLAVSGARWFAAKQEEQRVAVNFFMSLVSCHIERWCIENPVCIMSTRYRKPDQIIQPWMFGDMEQKTTCLWLKNLPKLVPTNNVYEAMMLLPKRERERVHHMSPGPERAAMRSKTYQGIANAMADQWGNL